MWQELRVDMSQELCFAEDALSDYDAVSISTAGAALRSDPHAIAAQCAQLAAKYSTVKLELPVLFQVDMPWLDRLLAALENLPVILVVNDWGTLYRLAPRSSLTPRVLHAGRWLSYSFYNSPGHSNIVAADDGSWNGYNLSNESTLAALAELGVTGIEVDAHSDANAELAQWRRGGFVVTAFVTQPRASLLRRSAAQRGLVSYGEVVELTPRERWVRFDDAFVPISPAVAVQLGQLCLRGDTVTRRMSVATTAISGADAVCTEWQWAQK